MRIKSLFLLIFFGFSVGISSIALAKKCLSVALISDEAAITAQLQSELVDRWSGLAVERAQIRALWIQLDLDGVLSTEIDKAVAQVRENTGYWERYLSGWGTDAGAKFADEMATRVFNSAAMQSALQTLIGQVVASLQTEMQTAVAPSVDGVLQCMKQYTREQFGSQLAQALQQQFTAQLPALRATVEAPAAAITPARLLSAGGLTLLLARRVVARMVALVAQRVGLRIATRWVPMVGWALFIGDFWWSADGVLPDIATELRSSTTRDALIDNVTTSLQEELLDPSLLAAALAAQLVREWQQFQANYQGLLTLAQQSPAFRAVLDLMPTAELSRFTQVATQLRGDFDDATVIRWAVSGDLRRFAALPTTATAVLQAVKRMDTVFLWRERLPDDEIFRQFSQTTLYRDFQPTQFDEITLRQLLALGHETAITAVARLAAVDRTAILALPPAYLAAVSGTLTAADWANVAFYLRHLPSEKTDRSFFLDVVRDYPDRLVRLASPTARQRVIQAREPAREIAALTDIPPPLGDFLLFGLDLSRMWPAISINEATFSALMYIGLTLLALPLVILLGLWLLRFYLGMLWRTVWQGLRGAPLPRREPPSIMTVAAMPARRRWRVRGYDAFARENYVVGVFDTEADARRAEAQARQGTQQQPPDLRDEIWIEAIADDLPSLQG